MGHTIHNLGYDIKDFKVSSILAVIHSPPQLLGLEYKHILTERLPSSHCVSTRLPYKVHNQPCQKLRLSNFSRYGWYFNNKTLGCKRPTQYSVSPDTNTLEEIFFFLHLEGRSSSTTQRQPQGRKCPKPGTEEGTGTRNARHIGRAKKW
jgi:hypothetical protein